jgi:hypothetical protein
MRIKNKIMSGKLSKEMEQEPTKEKPKVVYHGSANLGIEEVEPRAKRIRDNAEGRVVFAAESKAFASTFLGPRFDDRLSSRGSYNGVYYILIADEEKYRQEDGGGVIYELPGDKFEHDANKGMKTEWLTKEPVVPIGQQRYDSAVVAMIENGVQVYFADKETLDRLNVAIKEAPDHGLSVLKNLKPENEKLDKNFKSPWK